MEKVGKKMKPASTGYSSIQDAYRALLEENQALKGDIASLEQRKAEKLRKIDSNSQRTRGLEIRKEQLHREHNESEKMRARTEEKIQNNSRMLDLCKASLEHAHKTKDFVKHRATLFQKQKAVEEEKLNSLRVRFQQKIADVKAGTQDYEKKQKLEEAKTRELALKLSAVQNATITVKTHFEQKLECEKMKKSDLNGKLQSKKRSAAECKNKEAVLIDQKMNLERKKAKLQVTANDWERKCNDQREEISQLEQSKSNLRQQNETVARQISFIKDKTSKNQEAVMKMTSDTEACEAEMTSLSHQFSADLATTMSRCSELEDQIRVEESKCASSSDNVAVLRTKNAFLYKRFSQMEEEAQALQKKLESDKEAVKKRQQQVQTLQCKQQQLESLLSEQNREKELKQGALEVVKKQVEDFASALKSAETTEIALKNKVSLLSEELEKLNLSLAEQEESIRDLQSQLTSLKETIDQLESERDAFIEQTKHQEEATEAEIATLEKELEEQKNNLELVKEGKENTANLLILRDEKIQSLQQALKSLQESSEVESDQVGEVLNAQRDELELEIRTLETKLQSLTEEAKKTKEEISALEKSFPDNLRSVQEPWDEDLKLKNAEIEALRSQLAELEQNLKTEAYARSGLEEEIASTSAQLQFASEELLSLQNEQKKLEEEMKKQEEAVKESEKFYEELGAEGKLSADQGLEDLDVQLKAVIMELEEKERLVGALETELAAAEDSLHQLTATLEEQQKANQELATLERTLETECKDQEAQLEAASHEEETLRAEKDRLERELRDVEKDYEDLQDENKAVDLELEGATKAMNAADNELESLQQEISKLKAELESATRRLAEAEKENKDLEADVQNAMQKKEKIQDENPQPTTASPVEITYEQPSSSMPKPGPSSRASTGLIRTYTRRSSAAASSRKTPEPEPVQEEPKPKAQSQEDKDAFKEFRPLTTSTPIEEEMDNDGSLDITALLASPTLPDLEDPWKKPMASSNTDKPKEPRMTPWFSRRLNF